MNLNRVFSEELAKVKAAHEFHEPQVKGHQFVPCIAS